jgi:hypothetical protein
MDHGFSGAGYSRVRYAAVLDRGAEEVRETWIMTRDFQEDPAPDFSADRGSVRHTG